MTDSNAKQRALIGHLLKEYGAKTESERMTVINSFFWQRSESVKSLSDLTNHEAAKVIDHLRRVIHHRDQKAERKRKAMSRS